MAAAPPNAGLALVGVNLAGAEFGSDMENGPFKPGVYGTDYTYPTHAEIDAYAAAGLNIARVPFAWERLQPALDGDLDPAELARLDDVVSYAARRNMMILLDPHNYGYYRGRKIGTAAAPASAFAEFWGSLARHYRESANVIFGLMNEPVQQTPAEWVAPVNAAIAAIRAAGARQPVFVPGPFHSNGWAWVRQGSDKFALAVTDPASNIVFEVHQYLDATQSGVSTVPLSPDIGPLRLADVTSWARAHQKRLFLGEFGAGREPESLQAMANLLAFLQANADVWLGATIWGGGPWWPRTYPWATDPVNGELSPQIKLLKSFAPHG